LMYDTMFRLMCGVSAGPYSRCEHGAGIVVSLEIV